MNSIVGVSVSWEALLQSSLVHAPFGAVTHSPSQVTITANVGKLFAISGHYLSYYISVYISYRTIPKMWSDLTHAQKMAARGILLSVALAGFLVFWKFWLCLELESPQQSWKHPWSTPTKFSPSLLPRYVAFKTFSHLRNSRIKALWKLSLLRRLVRGQNTILLRAGDIEENPGPYAAGKQMTRKDRLTVMHLNTRSLLRHFDDVASLVSVYCPQVLALSETWLDSLVGNSEIHLPGYSSFRCDRNRSGGGVAIYCLDSLTCSLLSCGTSPAGVEFLWVSVKPGCFNPSLALGCFYRPPSSQSKSVLDVCDNIKSMMLTSKHLVACGDFNVDMSDLSKPHSKSFQNFITSHSLIQSISLPTRYSNSSSSILDLFIATPDVPILKSLVLDSSFSDNLPILLQFDCAAPKPLPTLVSRRSFKHFSKANFEKDLTSVPWCVLDVFDDPADKVEAFNLLFTDILDLHAPVKTVRVKKNPTPWIDKNIRKEMDRRDRLYCFYRRNPSSASRDIFKAQRNRVVWLQRKAKIEYFQRLISKNSHPSAIWNTLKLATSSASSASPDNWSSFNSDPASIANTLNAHFASVSSPTVSPSPDPPCIPSSAPTCTLSLQPTTPERCEETLANLKPRCATGLDQIPSSALIAAWSVICYPLFHH